MFEAKEILKRYGDFVALKNFSVFIEKGEIVALIGPNGAGKSTFFKSISGIIKYDEGEIRLNNVKAPNLIKSKLCFLPENPVLRNYFTVRDLYKVHLNFYGLSLKNTKESLYEFSKIFNLQDCLNKRLISLSKGMRRKAYFMSSLANVENSDMILLDEPFDGLDPESRVKIREYLKSLKDKIILFSSHTLFDVEKLADRIVLINKGKLYKEIRDIKVGGLEDEFMKMIGGKNED